MLGSCLPAKDFSDWNAEQVSFLLGKIECHRKVELEGTF